MTTLLIPAILKTKEAHDYVGGRPFWEDLVKHYGHLLKPVRTTEVRNNSYYRRESIDKALLVAEVEGKLLHEAPKTPPAKRGAGKHLTTPPADLSATD